MDGELASMGKDGEGNVLRSATSAVDPRFARSSFGSEKGFSIGRIESMHSVRDGTGVSGDGCRGIPQVTEVSKARRPTYTGAGPLRREILTRTHSSANRRHLAHGRLAASG